MSHSSALSTHPSRWWVLLRRPSTQTDLLQILKAAVAAVLAWLLAAEVLGLSFGVAQLVGPTAVALGVAVLLGMVLSRIGILRDEGVTVATTALFVLTQRLSGEDLHGLLWPVYGALISDLRQVIDVVDDVATSRPVRT